MSLLNTAIEIFIKNLASNNNVNLDSGLVGQALQQLLPTDGDELDIGALVGQFMGDANLSSVVGSWLANGANQSIDSEQIMKVFGDGKVSQFANMLGMDTSMAASGLASTIPVLIDKNSDGGSLMSSATAALAKGLLGKFGL